MVASNSDHIPITHPDMTRFWISLQDGIDFVVKAFSRMSGGEIFVPKLPSVRIEDIATAVAPGLPKKIVGIRPGEKFDDVMCTKDESWLTLEYLDHYVITPGIKFFSGSLNYETNQLGEAGQWVEDNFEYSSGNNKEFLTLDQLSKMGLIKS